MDAKVRLYVDQPLGAGQAVAVGPEQASYLFSVMRLPVGAGVLLFNGRDGEWLARVVDAGKRRGALLCEVQTKPLQLPPDMWLLFSPVRKERTNFIVEKAVELGVARLMPVTTRFTQGERWRQDKQLAHAIEAAEQCGATAVPQVGEVQPLERALAGWPADRALFWADEALAGAGPGAAGLAGLEAGRPGAILIGPEGGFSDAEQALLRGLPFVRPISLGPRILRAETAAVAALVLWQMAAGDWR
ncbi:16S rRNA (uracil(1498)-N(3))-methyltransferase [Pseudotabrizicola formosa]|uniref:16S rRNA (uracil(1498)-N(3))-methyltransferase n=1 Tax=Pseudotabrizicola formosa TaxID=2030009 RepID=UPI000CD2F44B|nr:16S rRNA (uracil(1498)-N(3))-methyltransferase [Pseudotabrizicola formosa]